MRKLKCFKRHLYCDLPPRYLSSFPLRCVEGWDQPTCGGNSFVAFIRNLILMVIKQNSWQYCRWGLEHRLTSKLKALHCGSAPAWPQWSSTKLVDDKECWPGCVSHVKEFLKVLLPQSLSALLPLLLNTAWVKPLFLSQTFPIYPPNRFGNFPDHLIHLTIRW